MESASRADLLQFRSAVLRAGRTLIAAEAIAELAGRAFARHAVAGCGPKRVERLDLVLAGRRRQILAILENSIPAEGATAYAPAIDAIGSMRIVMQSHRARETIDYMLAKAKEARHG